MKATLMIVLFFMWAAASSNAQLPGCDDPISSSQGQINASAAVVAEKASNAFNGFDLPPGDADIPNRSDEVKEVDACACCNGLARSFLVDDVDVSKEVDACACCNGLALAATYVSNFLSKQPQISSSWNSSIADIKEVDACACCNGLALSLLVGDDDASKEVDACACCNGLDLANAYVSNFVAKHGYPQINH